MIFNDHSRYEGQHAFLGASKYHWINYDEVKVASAYTNFLATQKGTELHAFAAQCIRLGQKLPKSKKALNITFILRHNATGERFLQLSNELRLKFTFAHRLLLSAKYQK